MYIVLLCTMDNQFVDKWKSQVKKGVLEYIILLLLNGNELYGYELLDRLRKTTGYEVAEGTIYPLLNRLKEENLITASWVEMESGVPRKYYKMTAPGRKMLKQMQAYWAELNKNITNITGG
jgi:PadR family transcriptional regulator PadR